MNKVEMMNAIKAKVQELNDSIESIKNNLELSQNTVRTQTYQRTHEVRNLLIMLQLLEGKELTGDVQKWFESAVTLTATRKAATTIVFHDGDDMLKIMDEHPNKSYKELKEIMAKQGFMLDGHTVRK